MIYMRNPNRKINRKYIQGQFRKYYKNSKMYTNNKAQKIN